MVDMKEVRKKAKDTLKGWCRVCPVCNGRACAGEMPGMGGAGGGATFMENVQALAAWKVNLRVLHDVKDEPDTKCDLWGMQLDMPVMGAPMTGTSYNLGGTVGEEDMAVALIAGCRKAGTLGWSGDGAHPALFDTGVGVVKKLGGVGIPTIKPRTVAAIIERFRKAEDAGAVAVAVDVDAAGFHAMSAKGQPVGPLGARDITALVEATRLPLVLKGIMTADEAALAASLGVAGIVVSNHGGRVLDCGLGTADALPAVSAAVRGRVKIFMDGGVRSGVDVLKALALGADAVLVGRPLIVAAAGGGEEGVAALMRQYAQELRTAMTLTGTASAGNVPFSVLTRQP